MWIQPLLWIYVDACYVNQRIYIFKYVDYVLHQTNRLHIVIKEADVNIEPNA